MQGSVIGEPTEEFVTNQVKIRQQTYAKGLGNNNRTPQDLQFMNNRNAWIKMASSVEIEKNADFRVPFGTGTPSNFKGSKLAKNAILFNGLSSFDGSKLNMRAGVNAGAQAILPSTSYFNNSAYGLGGSEFGILPMPGINSVSIDSKNRGSIKTATIQIIAFNRYQFDIIETLYCRLGFSMIVEWGWDKYIDNKGVYQTIGSTVLENNFFGGSDQNQIISEINNTSDKYDGNTGGLFGKVVNFNWKYNVDGSYNITVKITGLGDVIESMKINQSPSLALKNSLGNLSHTRYSLLENAKSSIHTNRTVTKLGTVLYQTLDESSLWNNGGNGDYFNLYQALKLSTYKSFLDGKTTDGMKIEYNYFIRFGELLAIIQKHITPDINRASGTTKFVNFDQNTEKVICSITPNLISFDPAVCIIKLEGGVNLNTNDITGIEVPDYTDTLKPFSIIKGNTVGGNTTPPPDYEIIFEEIFGGIFGGTRQIIKKISIGQFDQQTDTYTDENGVVNTPPPIGYKWKSESLLPNATGTSVKGTLMYGQILNIYLNYDMIFNTLSKNVDKKGNLTFFKFLQSICDNINSSFANVIDIEPIIKDDKTITFMDTKPVAGLNKPSNLKKILPNVLTETAEFEVVGFNNKSTGPNEASFLKNISFNTKFSPKLASQLSIGATAKGVALGQDATGLSKWNSGLQDRFQRTIEDPDTVFTSLTGTSGLSGGNTTPQTLGGTYNGRNQYLKKLLNGQNAQQNYFPKLVQLSMPMLREARIKATDPYAGTLEEVDGITPISITIDKDGQIINGAQIPFPGAGTDTTGRIPYTQMTYIERKEATLAQNYPSASAGFAGGSESRADNTIRNTFGGSAGGALDGTLILNGAKSSDQISQHYVQFDIDNDGRELKVNGFQKEFMNKSTGTGLFYYEAIMRDIINAVAEGYGVRSDVNFSNADYNGGTRTNNGLGQVRAVDGNGKYIMPEYDEDSIPTSGNSAGQQQINKKSREIAGANYSAYLAQMFGGEPRVPTNIQLQFNFNLSKIKKKDSEYTFRPNEDSFSKAGKSSYKIYLDEDNKKAQQQAGGGMEPSNQIGLLPIEFDMEMEGIAGFRIYNKIKINQRFLPSNYANTLEFLIKGINHKIDGSGWTTNLQTLSTSNLNARTINTTPNPPSSSGSTSGGNAFNITAPKQPPSELVLAMRRYGITAPLERAHFLAQVAHESMDYFYKGEIWGPTATQRRYEMRLSIGNDQPGDGKKYKGRGYIQLTGKANYKDYNDDLITRGDNVDVLNNPDIVETEKYAADSAAYWWTQIGKASNMAAVRGATDRDVEKVSIRVNGRNRQGTANGLDDRRQKFANYWAAIQADNQLYA